MNLALFLTRNNIEGLRPIVKTMAEMQSPGVNGACIVVHDATINSSDLSFIMPLARLFKVSASLPIHIGNGSDSVSLAAMFSRFLTAAYAKYPGPWLLFDEPATPKDRDFMQAALMQHGQYGGRMTGRASTNPGSATPIGPVTLELDFKALKFLRHPTRQSWRERGQFLFARAGFQLVPADEWLFTMAKVEATQLDPSFLKSITVNDFDNQSDANLVFFIEKVTGKKPHHFTGREKLLSMARELTTAPA